MKKYLAIIIVFLLMLVVGCKKVEPHLEVSFDSVEIIDGNVKLEYGDTVKLNALYKPGDIIEGIEIKKSDDDLVLLIDENGLITAVGIGNSRLEISYINDKNVEFKEEINVEVVERVNKIERILISSKNVVPVGNIFMATVNTFGSNSDEEIIFESSNTEIATIDPDGTVYGVSTGECEIFAYVKGNESLKDKMTIHVIDVNTETEADRAKYRVIDSSSYKTLPYGIKFKKVSALTSTPLSDIDADGYSGITQTIVANQYYSQQVSLLEIPRTSEVKITSWANLGNHKWSLTTVKGLINNYEKNNPGWKVVAAINGDFFDINANGNLPYQTSGPVVSNGEFYKTSGSWMVGFSNDGSTNTLIGGEPITRTEYMILAIYDDNGNIIKEFDIEKINSEPGEGETSVYYANYNSDKKIEEVELVDENNLFVVEEAELALPNSANDFYGKGVISKTTKATLGVGSFAIKTNNFEVLKYLKVGTKIRCQFEFTGAYANIKDFCVCRHQFLTNGEYDHNGAIEDRAPRTAIGVKEDGTIVMMVIDGRQGNKEMFGAEAREMAAIMKSYGCVSAYNLDGGGSSTMVIRDGDKFVVTNSPSDGRERSDGNCLLIVVKDVAFENSVSEIGEDKATINVKVLDDTGKKIEKLYVQIDGNFYEVKDEKVVLDNLVHNSEYTYKLFYQNENGDLIETVTSGTFTTLKKMYKYLNTYVSETEETFEIELRYLDIDKCSTLNGCKITIKSIKDGEAYELSTFIQNGKLSLKKSVLGEKIESISYEFSYCINGADRESVVMENIAYKIVK